MGPVSYGKNVTTWDRTTPEWRSGCAWLIAVFLAGFLVGFFIGSSAPRSAPTTTPRPDASASYGPVGLSAQAQVRTSPARSPALPHPQPTTPVKALLEGRATYYDNGPGLYAAVHSYRWGDKRYELRVCLASGRVPPYHECVNVTVRDHCACVVNSERRLIDLSPAAFATLAPLWRGKIRVSIPRLTSITEEGR